MFEHRQVVSQVPLYKEFTTLNLILSNLYNYLYRSNTIPYARGMRGIYITELHCNYTF